MARWLDHMDHRAETLGDLLAIATIRGFCDQDDWDQRLAAEVWSAATRDSIRAHSATLLEHPRWPEVVRTGLESADQQEFWYAERGARLLGIDAFDQLLIRIEADPLGGPWFQAWQGVGPDRATLLAERAGRLLDLDAIASGPTTAIGLGPEFKPHAALGWTLQGLRGQVGVGAELVSAALRSPSVQNRHGALNVLDDWGVGQWTPLQEGLLQEMAASDPNEKVQERAAELVARTAERP